MTEQAFPQYLRLKNKAEFDEVFAAKMSAADGVLIVYARTNGLTHSRIGLAVSRRVGKAVVRNCWKRLVREAFRLQRADLPGGLDMVVIPRGGRTPTLSAVEQALKNLTKRLAKKAK